MLEPFRHRIWGQNVNYSQKINFIATFSIRKRGPISTILVVKNTHCSPKIILDVKEMYSEGKVVISPSTGAEKLLCLNVGPPLEDPPTGVAGSSILMERPRILSLFPLEV